ncbi:MAG: hypothetical protein IJ566_08905 [Cardiobacteriaceae bacterium]|nr:hypothetical protein [Cardiobacteriaceae bacterium]
MSSSGEHQKYKEQAAKNILRLICKYAPNRQDLIDYLKTDQAPYVHIRYYLSEIDRSKGDLKYTFDDLKEIGYWI